jgi:hypothetical protein
LRAFPKETVGVNFDFIDQYLAAAISAASSYDISRVSRDSEQFANTVKTLAIAIFL